MPKSDRKKKASLLPDVNIEDAVLPVSLRVVPLLLVSLGVEVASSAGRQGYTQARYSSWCTAAATGTFGILSTLSPFVQSSDTRALPHIIASLFGLGQTIHSLPRHVSNKSALWIFSLVSLGPLMANIIAIKSTYSSQLATYSKHPVEKLIHKGKEDFEELLGRQSQNYTAAHAEYQRRYGIEPPPGFEAWYNFARSHKSPIIDDFDMIHTAVSPFRRLSGKQVIETMDRAQSTADSELWLCTFHGSRAKTQCHHPSRFFDRHIQLLFDTLLKDVPGALPDVKFLVNHLDEPRVVVPLDKEKTASLGAYHQELSLWGQSSKQQSGNIRSSFRHKPNRGHEPMCPPTEYATMNGLFMSPTSLRLFEGLVPILSTGSPLTMGDILFPSPAYIESEFQYDSKNDVEWHQKRNNLYWAGSTTGAFAQTGSWKHYHRQRFVTLAQNLEMRKHRYIRETKGVITSVKSYFLNTRLYDVAFTKIFQCKTKYCREQRTFFPSKPWADKDKAFRSRLVFDIDGNAISGRYYKLLASRSTPLKQTLLREWHDDRLVPWVHYIPVSQSMEELPELVYYLTSTESGRRRAKEVADQGREWFLRAFREVDMTIYIYRLFLELARLQDPERKAS
ncbi:hypothetical protein TESG_06584 [Trichophyton tonsurans CBS 112818]|uniref:Glycosyl transferase CAP10 domain-containing protein n=1 Tax=Trichophyton tonsurans (strain CBS 112818) TaxID=647933 RepID=F2S6W7_TRIT1|nr:hypothetical protein TESG_06584 [Trichophyton tonsurans CBS 112818]